MILETDIKRVYMKSSLFLVIVLFSMVCQAKKMPVVIMDTSMGTIEIELNEDKAPLTVTNFLKYVDSGFYDKTIFHRVIDGFMIQGGGYLEGMKEKKTEAAIKNEAANGLSNDTGTIAMARTSDPHSATAQFFINVNDNHSLNHTSATSQGYGYAVFGKVTTGMHVVNRIKSVKTGTLAGFQNVPMDPVVIKSVKRK
jgi:peptidyl-prolyl cis-trans isomerase B (cyclophilin B)